MNKCSVLVVVSFYNARSDDRLDMLLSQLRDIPPGAPFDTMVVVNRQVDEDLGIAGKYPSVRVCYRENEGYNIGAWNHGWRQAPSYDLYVFLQDECLIAKAGWLRHLIARATSGKGRLIGESLVDPAETWMESQASYEQFYTSRGLDETRWDETTGELHTPLSIRRFLVEQSIEPLPTMRHLRSLMLCAPACLLRDIGGFPCGKSYREAVGAEVACSQRAQAGGYEVRQAALLPFTFIIHPQWIAERCSARTLKGMVHQAVQRMLPTSTRLAIRSLRQRVRP